jgi:hypothetical protein
MQDLERLLETDQGEQESIYLFEAICPFVRIFFQRFYRPTEPLLESQVPRHREITGKVVDMTLAFLKRLQEVPSYGTPQRVRDVNTVLLVFEAKARDRESE